MAKKAVSVIDLDQLIGELAHYKDKKSSFPVQLSYYSSFYSELYTKLTPFAKKILILLIVILFPSENDHQNKNFVSAPDCFFAPIMLKEQS